MSRSIGTLYTTPNQHHGKVIRAVAKITNQIVTLPTDYVHFESNKTSAFTTKFPHGKIPSFEGADGFLLFEGVAIARYLAALSPQPNLLGSTKQEAALVDQWISFAMTEIGQHAFVVHTLMAHFMPYNKVVDTNARAGLVRSLTTLDSHLLSHTFVASQRLSLADLYLAGVLQGAFATLVDAALRDKLPNLRRYYETVTNQNGLPDIFGETKYIDKAVQYAPPSKDNKKREEEPKEKPKEKPSKQADDDNDDDESDTPQEPKAKNPLDDLKSTFNLEDWKRAYSNMETRGKGGSLEWFYDKFDPAGFSIWRIDFKYNQELTQVFMSSNQIGGFFNRLEATRKYLFGSMGVLGTANSSIITGVLVCRGPDHKAVVQCAPDWESYEYTPLRVTGANHSAEDKAFFEAAMAWDLEIDGKKWADGKNFK